MRRDACVAAAIGAIVLVCGASASELPPEVSAQVHDLADLCRQVKGSPVVGPNIEHGNLAAGIEFWAIDEDTFQCEGAASLVSGSRGSQVLVYVSAPSGHAKKAFEHGAFGMTIEHSGRFSTLWIGVGGQFCGQVGDPTTAELISCERTLMWNANAQKLDFAPLSEARFQNSGAHSSEAAASSLREKPASAPKPLFYQTALHNGSQVVVSEWKDGTVEIVYDVPRRNMPVVKGMLLFRGVKAGVRYSGTAYTFKAGCPPAPYTVAGFEDDRREIIALTGAAPRRDPHSCNVIGGSSGSAHSRLVFDTHIDGDE